jgi:hypothetical protein
VYDTADANFASLNARQARLGDAGEPWSPDLHRSPREILCQDPIHVEPTFPGGNANPYGLIAPASPVWIVPDERPPAPPECNYKNTIVIGGQPGFDLRSGNGHPATGTWISTIDFDCILNCLRLCFSYKTRSVSRYPCDVLLFGIAYRIVPAIQDATSVLDSLRPASGSPGSQQVCGRQRWFAVRPGAKKRADGRGWPSPIRIAVTVYQCDRMTACGRSGTD